jgi:hypothetical protein
VRCVTNMDPRNKYEASSRRIMTMTAGYLNPIREYQSDQPSLISLGRLLTAKEGVTLRYPGGHLPDFG